MSSILTARLKAVLHKVIGLQQTAYVPSKRITNGRHCQSLSYSYMEFHVDDHEIHEVSREVHFMDQRVCDNCLIFHLFNGSLHDLFSSFRGLREGDPLSPYLFIMVMEVFKALLLKNIEEGGFDYHPFYSKSFHVVKNTLNEFGGLDGLYPNIDKNCCFFVDTSNIEIVCLERIMKIPIGKLSVKYLGVPSTSA
ncbi:hypothetical protein LIER_23972 [Lithospermum erythrorhizon]|uniref:Reverse transcriptase domain-containing protein n=1 Tax=Lithospermum erythrorhizon TaxID=34254 RepID=A0AAV3R2H5_LITER